MNLRWLLGTDDPSALDQGLAGLALAALVLLVVLFVVGAPSPWTGIVQVVLYASLLTLWVQAFRRRRDGRGRR